jgi:Tol biopolymer transport system component
MPSYTPPALNPSGQNIAYEEYGKPMNYVMGAGAYPFDPSMFGYQSAKDAMFINPSWSPDGRWLSWWVSDKPDSPQKFDLVLFDHTGAGTYTIIHTYTPFSGTNGWPLSPVWSPDGNWITFQTQGEITFQDLWISRPDGSNAYRLGLATNPVWNPDSQHLAYVQRPANVDPNLAASISVLEITSWTTFSSSLPAGSIPLAWRKK